MHVKRVFRPTVREALAAAREELGPGALVLSTELVPAPGWRGWMGQRIVRLTAAAERGESEPLVTPADLSAERPVVTTDRHVPERVSSRLDAGVMDHLRAGVMARLVAAGMDRALAEAVTARLTDAECRGASDRVLRRALTAELEPLAGGDDPYERCEVFVGPPGVGKTTTVAKIAAQERLVHNRALNLVSADAFKAGAIEQLQSYAEIMAVPFRVARTPAELDHALSAARNPVLLDTAGRAPSEDGVPNLIRVLEQKRRVRTHLVLAADTSSATAGKLIDRYAPFKPSRVVITKLDEAESVMPVMTAVRERGLPVSFLTAGQRVAEELWRATPASLAAVLLREAAMEDRTCH
jgi:flagellar biosynthesis protein FlhF